MSTVESPIGITTASLFGKIDSVIWNQTWKLNIEGFFSFKSLDGEYFLTSDNKAFFVLQENS